MGAAFSSQITFNQLLRVGDLASETVRLLRYRDSTPKIHRALYDAAMKNDPGSRSIKNARARRR